jgi:DNA-3-methyladenine glycosylase
VLQVAPDLLGKWLVRKTSDDILSYRITEVEVYRGEEDEACHARRGRTPRTEVMYGKGGLLYVYLIYGMHWMLNVVSGPVNQPQAVLIRGLDQVKGPGRLTKALKIDASLNKVDITHSNAIWIEGDETTHQHIITTPRIGIDYAGDYYRNIHWRFLLDL